MAGLKKPGPQPTSRTRSVGKSCRRSAIRLGGTIRYLNGFRSQSAYSTGYMPGPLSRCQGVARSSMAQVNIIAHLQSHHCKLVISVLGQGRPPRGRPGAGPLIEVHRARAICQRWSAKPFRWTFWRGNSARPVEFQDASVCSTHKAGGVASVGGASQLNVLGKWDRNVRGTDLTPEV